MFTAAEAKDYYYKNIFVVTAVICGYYKVIFSGCVYHLLIFLIPLTFHDRKKKNPKNSQTKPESSYAHICLA